jgi:hypothetical protein
VLERRPCLRGVVDAENEASTLGPRSDEVADLRVVAVHDEQRVRQLRHGRAPASGHELELAVAVELVAEEVPEAERARPDAPRHLGQGSFVDLEQAELGVARAEERGGDPRDEVRPGAVVRQSDARGEDRGDHRGGRRLAVRGRDEDGSLREPCG